MTEEELAVHLGYAINRLFTDSRNERSFSSASVVDLCAKAAKAYAAAENQRLRDMLKAIIAHADQPAMDDALFRKFARANAEDVLNEEGGGDAG